MSAGEYEVDGLRVGLMNALWRDNPTDGGTKILDVDLLLGASAEQGDQLVGVLPHFAGEFREGFYGADQALPGPSILADGAMTASPIRISAGSVARGWQRLGAFDKAPQVEFSLLTRCTTYAEQAGALRLRALVRVRSKRQAVMFHQPGRTLNRRRTLRRPYLRRRR
jgi:hypothetical protein